jgi:hypothetical protein
MNKLTAVLVGFCLALLISPPPFPQLNVVVKHKSTPLAFFQSTFVTTTSATPIASITSPALTLTAGDFVFVACRTGTSTTTITATSTPANTFTRSSGTGTASLGTIQTSWSFGVAAGSTTFTCTPAGTGPFQNMVVLEYHPGFLTTIDSQVGSSGSGTGTTITSASFSTAAKGLIIMCVTTNAGNHMTAGTIGSGSATLREVSDGIGTNTAANTGCEDSITAASQSTITGTLTLNASENWVSTVNSFK